MKRLAAILAGMAWDLMLVLGAAAVAVGAGMIYLPAGFITGGMLAMALAALGALAEPGRKRNGKEGDGG